MPAATTGPWDVLNTLIANLPAIIAAVAAIVGLIINNRRAKEVKAELAVAKSDLQNENAAQKEVLSEVKVLVNGNLDKEKKDNARLRAQLKGHGIEPITDRPEPR